MESCEDMLPVHVYGIEGVKEGVFQCDTQVSRWKHQFFYLLRSESDPYQFVILQCQHLQGCPIDSSDVLVAKAVEEVLVPYSGGKVLIFSICDASILKLSLISEYSVSSNSSSLSTSSPSEAVMKSHEKRYQANISLEMKFRRYKSSVHWDLKNWCIEEMCRCPLTTETTNSWPSGIKLQEVNCILPKYLRGKLMMVGAIIVVQIMESVFELEISGINFLDKDATHVMGFVGSENAVYIDSTERLSCNISCIDSALQTEAVINPEPKRLVKIISNSVMRIVLAISKQTLLPPPSDQNIRKNVYSVLVTGFEGTGKSTLLNYLENKMKSKLRFGGESIIRMRGRQSRAYDRSEKDSTASGNNLHILESLYSRLGSNDVTMKPLMGPVLLLIDDLEDILMATKLLVDDVSSHTFNWNMEGLSDLQICSVLLRRLLSQLSCTSSLEQPDSTDSLRIMVVAACRTSPSLQVSSMASFLGFEKVLDIGKCDFYQRKHILKSALKALGMNLSEIPESTRLPATKSYFIDDLMGKWVSRIAHLTPGSTPGDLVKLIDRSTRLNTGMSTEYPNNSHSVRSKLLRWTSMQKALASFVPDQLTDIVHCDTRISGLSWDSFGGYDEIKADLKKRIIGKVLFDGCAESENLRKFTSVPSGMIISGPSGCGKTFLAKIIAAEANMNFVYIKTTELLSPYLGQTEVKVRTLFQQARSSSPCALFFDDFDVLAYRRNGGDGSNSVNARVLSTFLNELDGIDKTNSTSSFPFFGISSGDSSDEVADSESTLRDGSTESSMYERVLVIAACSDASILDEALVRPGRLHYNVVINLPNFLDLLEILTIRTRSMPCGEDVDFRLLASHLHSYRATGADVNALCNAVSVRTIRSLITDAQSSENVREFDYCELDPIPYVHMTDFIDAIEEYYQVISFFSI